MKPDSTLFPALDSGSTVEPVGQDRAGGRDVDDDRVDTRLVDEARGGEAGALETLLTRHEGRVLRVLRLMGVPAQDREDVAQEVLLRVFRHLGRFQRGRPFRSWIYRIAVNAAHDYRVRRGRTAGEAPLDPVVELRDREPDPETAAERRDLQERLFRAMGHLTDRERAVFSLVEIEGLETAEVAHALGIARVTVRRHLGLARRRLEKAFDPGATR